MVLILHPVLRYLFRCEWVETLSLSATILTLYRQNHHNFPIFLKRTFFQHKRFFASFNKASSEIIIHLIRGLSSSKRIHLAIYKTYENRYIYSFQKSFELCSVNSCKTLVPVQVWSFSINVSLSWFSLLKKFSCYNFPESLSPVARDNRSMALLETVSRMPLRRSLH